MVYGVDSLQDCKYAFLNEGDKCFKCIEYLYLKEQISSSKIKIKLLTYFYKEEVCNIFFYCPNKDTLYPQVEK